MHNLESILFVTSVAVEKGKIGKTELARVLMRLASTSHDYEPRPYSDIAPWRNADEALNEMHDEWVTRFGHLIENKSTT